MMQKTFYSRIKEELQKNKPNIESLLFQAETNEQQRQFNDFVINHLCKYIKHHNYYEEIKETLANNVHKNQSSQQNQNNERQSKQPINISQIRVCMDRLIKAEKELIQYRQSIKKSQLNLQKLRSFKFGVLEQEFDKKINYLVHVMNTYEEFLSSFSFQRQNLEQFKKKWTYTYSANQFPNNFFQQMRKIRHYVLQYLQGLQVIKRYSQTNLPELQMDSFKQNIQIICKNSIKKREQIQKIKQILKQLIQKIRADKQITKVQKLKRKSDNIQILQLIRQLKKQIDLLLVSSRNNQQVGGLLNFSFVNPYSWFPRVFSQNLINEIYNKVPGTQSNLTIYDKLNKISKRMDQCNQTIDTIDKYSILLNQFVVNCFCYFGINYSQNILQHAFSFSLQSLQILNQTVKSCLSEKLLANNRQKSVQSQKNKAIKKKELGIKNRLILQDQFQDISQQIQVNKQSVMQESIDYLKQYKINMESLKQKENQIKQWVEKYKQILKELTKVKQYNTQLLTIKQQKINLKQAKKKQLEVVKLKELANTNTNSQFLKQYIELKHFYNQALNRIEQLSKQISTLKEENQIYLDQKIKLKNYIDVQRQFNKNQLKSLQTQKEEQKDKLKKIMYEEKQGAINRIRDQNNKQKKELKAEIKKIQQQYINFKNKYYEQVQQRLNQSIQIYQKNRSREYEQANVNTSMILSDNKQDSKDELNQIIRLRKQNNKKFQDQIEEYKANLSKMEDQLLKIKKEKESSQKLLAQKLQFISQLQQNLKKSEIQKVQLQNTLKDNLQDLQKLQQTFRQLEATIQNQRKEKDAKKQIQQNLNNNTQIPSNLPTLVHYTRQLFNVDIFYNNQEDKKILVNHLEWYARSRITNTHLLCKFDPKNKTNFHQYIDQIEGLALIIKTKNAIIAGFYPGILRDKQTLNKGGLIISVTNNNSYCLHERKKGDTKSIYRGMIYDTFFAIFGNAQIRVKTGFKTVFSNFGVSNSYFNSRGDKVNQFLNEGEKREVQFQYCQFYQVSFENQLPNFR